MNHVSVANLKTPTLPPMTISITFTISVLDYFGVILSQNSLFHTFLNSAVQSTNKVCAFTNLADTSINRTVSLQSTPMINVEFRLVCIYCL